MTRVLITGAAGFLGREVVRCAQAAGLRLRATDCRRGDLPAMLDFRPADITVPATLYGLFDGVDCVIHVAGLAHVFNRAQAAKASFERVNALGAAHMARAAAAAGVKHLVLISSVSVYGPHGKGRVDETVPCRPEGPYAESKLRAEQLAIEAAAAAGMGLTILRLATLYGEGDPGNVARLFRAIDRRRFLWIGDGSNQKSLIHCQDAARACIAAAMRAGHWPRKYNVAAPPYTMRQIVEAIAAALSRDVPQWRIPASAALALGRAAGAMTLGRTRIGRLATTLRKWLADDAYSATRFESDFCFRAKVGLVEGIYREAAWYRAARSASTPIAEMKPISIDDRERNVAA